MARINPKLELAVLSTYFGALGIGIAVNKAPFQALTQIGSSTLSWFTPGLTLKFKATTAVALGSQLAFNKFVIHKGAFADTTIDYNKHSLPIKMAEKAIVGSMYFAPGILAYEAGEYISNTYFPPKNATSLSFNEMMVKSIAPLAALETGLFVGNYGQKYLAPGLDKLATKMDPYVTIPKLISSVILGYTFSSCVKILSRGANATEINMPVLELNDLFADQPEVVVSSVAQNATDLVPATANHAELYTLGIAANSDWLVIS